MNQNHLNFAASLYTQKKQKIEDIDLKLLLQPFSDIVWICILATAGMTIIVKLLILNKKVNLIGILWDTCMANLGGNFDQYQTGRNSYKMLIFLSLFGGNLVWMGYQASLTVDLSVSEPKLPFYDFEGLLRSDWKLFTLKKT